MKFPILLLTALCMSVSVRAHDEQESSAHNDEQEILDLSSGQIMELLDAAQDIAMIRYTVTLYKDRIDGHDEDAWRNVISKTTKSLRSLEDANWADDVAEVFRAARCIEGDSGVHGEISVTLSDGEPSSCCGEQCKCAERYRGNCPCSMDNVSCATRGQDDAQQQEEKSTEKKPCCK